MSSLFHCQFCFSAQSSLFPVNHFFPSLFFRPNPLYSCQSFLSKSSFSAQSSLFLSIIFFRSLVIRPNPLFSCQSFFQSFLSKSSFSAQSSLNLSIIFSKSSFSAQSSLFLPIIFSKSSYSAQSSLFLSIIFSKSSYSAKILSFFLVNNFFQICLYSAPTPHSIFFSCSTFSPLPIFSLSVLTSHAFILLLPIQSSLAPSPVLLYIPLPSSYISPSSPLIYPPPVLLYPLLSSHHLCGVSFYVFVLWLRGKVLSFLRVSPT